MALLMGVATVQDYFAVTQSQLTRSQVNSLRPYNLPSIKK